MDVSSSEYQIAQEWLIYSDVREDDSDFLYDQTKDNEMEEDNDN
jgi:hypothetical protein